MFFKNQIPLNRVTTKKWAKWADQELQLNCQPFPVTLSTPLFWGTEKKIHNCAPTVSIHTLPTSLLVLPLTKIMAQPSFPSWPNWPMVEAVWGTHKKEAEALAWKLDMPIAIFLGVNYTVKFHPTWCRCMCCVLHWTDTKSSAAHSIQHALILKACLD